METPARLTRRMAGLLAARLPEMRLDQVSDGRDERGRRWGLSALLRAVVVGHAIGCRSLHDLEVATADFSPASRQLLGLKGRVPDTTLRDALERIAPNDVRGVIHAQVRAAHRRKSVAPEDFPFGVLAIDGKCTPSRGCDDYYAQRQTGDGGKLAAVLRTVTCSLVTSRAKVVVDAVPIPASTNEMGVFASVIDGLMAAYGSLDLFRLVTYDAGACSEANARLVREHGLHYLFGLKSSQPTLLSEAKRLLGRKQPEVAVSITEDRLSGGRRIIRRLYVTEEMSSIYGWDHLSVALRVESETLDTRGQRLEREDRYFISSLPLTRLTKRQWLLLVRLHWAVENAAHFTLDTAFAEDAHPWIEASPRAALVVALLRRTALNLLALFRSVSQRSEERRALSWRELMHDLCIALMRLTRLDLEGIRVRPQLE